MKYSGQPPSPGSSVRQKGHGRPVLLAFILAVLCIGAAELAFCYLFSPVMFHRIVDPVVDPVVSTADAAAKAVQRQLRIWEFQRRRDGIAVQVGTAAKDYLLPRPVTQPQIASDYLFLEKPAPAEPTITEFRESNGKTILTGGGVACVYFNQGDDAWKDKLFGSDPIGPYGCGPTAMAIVVASMTDTDTDPAKMAAWAADNNYWCPGSGSYLSIVEGTAKAYGLECSLAKDCDAASLYRHLSSGGMAVALMGPGHFTKNGHFIVLHGSTLTGKVLVADPNSRDNSLALWEPQLIVDEAAASNGDGVRIWLINKQLIKGQKSP